jgi:hypothetical protein
MALEIFESLSDEEQQKIERITTYVKEQLTVDGVVSLDLLFATLEKMNCIKKDTREFLKEQEKKNAEEKKALDFERGKRYAQSLKIGDMVTFVYGPASNQKRATLPLEKVAPSTIQVTFSSDMIINRTITNRRNIRYDKIIVPADFN